MIRFCQSTISPRVPVHSGCQLFLRGPRAPPSTDKLCTSRLRPGCNIARLLPRKTRKHSRHVKDDMTFCHQKLDVFDDQIVACIICMYPCQYPDMQKSCSSQAPAVHFPSRPLMGAEQENGSGSLVRAKSAWGRNCLCIINTIEKAQSTCNWQTCRLSIDISISSDLHKRPTHQASWIYGMMKWFAPCIPNVWSAHFVNWIMSRHHHCLRYKTSTKKQREKGKKIQPIFTHVLMISRHNFPSRRLDSCLIRLRHSSSNWKSAIAFLFVFSRFRWGFLLGAGLSLHFLVRDKRASANKSWRPEMEAL